MHFPIIEISTKEERRFDSGASIYEDATLQYYTDYYGEEYADIERKDTISCGWFEEFFKGLGEVDVEKETVTLYDEFTIRKTLDDYFASVCEKLDELKNEKLIWRRFYALRNYGTCYKDESTLFFLDGAGYTSMQFVEDLIYNAGKTLYIGQIYDAHC